MQIKALMTPLAAAAVVSAVADGGPPPQVAPIVIAASSGAPPPPPPPPPASSSAPSSWTVVDWFTTVCPTPTVVTYNNVFYTATTDYETITITNCPCTVAAGWGSGAQGGGAAGGAAAGGAGQAGVVTAAAATYVQATAAVAPPVAYVTGAADKQQHAMAGVLGMAGLAAMVL
ncbi:hypothetical protein M406DRAFT_328674 [Cryphonectria parasitica EP155]|uniref:Uncharacterized protein n=1 Tax=Cryphonectria parasitica (strain ATCC 38755 / EP155) TaxID=660469 RepID=A0A9P4Y5Z8_CRYP1|nr:uncharacterized protein M406DRAFT_328674 [Cryphonectria parasitica EP155]KAF3767604.1 hypothetical protein M406DRAFT_328674 [Cryphonectria parasitica EP155]